MIEFNPDLYQFIVRKVIPSIDDIPRERKKLLDPIVRYIRSGGDQINLVFICTHNSRRSHLAQVWAQVAALFYYVEDIHTFSGGTEATAFNPNAVDALRRAGFIISSKGEGNPMYSVQFSEDEKPLTLFSKKYDHVANPKRNFAAIMTCSEADADCPLVPGASGRFPLHYLDPKLSDGTPDMEKTYQERSHQIAVEMFYIMSAVAD